MGVVPMSVKTLFISHGYAYDHVTLYIYCDQCGSFDIKHHASIRQWLLPIGSCTFITALLIAMIREYISPLFFLSSLIIIWIDVKLWGFGIYKCRKCGNKTTIRYNTRNYHSDVILDVPDKQTRKFYLEGWPDQGELSDYLEPPEGPKSTDSIVHPEINHTSDRV